MTSIRSIEERRFAALAGYTREPNYLQAVQEYDWLESDDGRVLGSLTWDRFDYDFGWIALARDAQLRFRAVGVDASLPSSAVARERLIAAMTSLQGKPDSAFHQGDEAGQAVDFLTPLRPMDELAPIFRGLIENAGYSPARGLVEAMMRYHEDADGNFVEQFQTTGFDARIWELYLFATFTELGFARVPNVQVPDFVLEGLAGRLGVEATSSNPTQGAAPAFPRSPEALKPYLENYIPIKLGRALRRKLDKPRPYWSSPEMKGTPFVIALQDFHGPGAMRFIVPAATEYVFGVRHSLVGGKRHVEWIKEHRFDDAALPSGFFRLPKSENVSAIIVNPQGTLVKFNRVGYIAGFGDRRVRMIRSGMRRHDADPIDPRPRPFMEEVHAPGYEETWVEGMVVLHNPNALIPLDPDLLPGATHEFLRPDGVIMSKLPGNPPYVSETMVHPPED